MVTLPLHTCARGIQLLTENIKRMYNIQYSKELRLTGISSLTQFLSVGSADSLSVRYNCIYLCMLPVYLYSGVCNVIHIFLTNGIRSYVWGFPNTQGARYVCMYFVFLVLDI